MPTKKSYFTRPLALVVWAVLAASVMLMIARPAWAATYTVTNTNDSGTGSLREAIDLASPGDTITFARDLNGSTITLTSGTLIITKNLTIEGLGRDDLAISGNNATRVFHIGTGSLATDVSISDLTIQDGKGGSFASAGGGGVHNSALGSLSLTNVAVSGNTSASYGGGIYNEQRGTVELTNTIVSGNMSGSGGDSGGILNEGLLRLANSTVSDNTSVGYGGGIRNGLHVIGSSSTVELTNSTVSGNTSSSSSGGGIANLSGTVELTNSTVSGNTSENGLGGGIYNWGGTVSLLNGSVSGNTSGSGGGGIHNRFVDSPILNTNLGNTIVADNAATDVFGPGFTSQGHNLIGGAPSDSGFTNGQNGDQVGTTDSPIDPLLEPLQDNGGPTVTHGLLPGSPAIDAADDATSPTTDQRGVARPQGAHSDIGAFELEQQAQDTTAPTVISTVPTGTTPVAPTTNVKATFSEPVQNVSPETFILERHIAVKKSPPKYVRVDATVSLIDGISAVLTPVEDLPKGEYRATITTEVTDMATPANALEDPVVWTFTVAKLP